MNFQQTLLRWILEIKKKKTSVGINQVFVTKKSGFLFLFTIYFSVVNKIAFMVY